MLDNFILKLDRDDLAGELCKDLNLILQQPGQKFTNYKAAGSIIANIGSIPVGTVEVSAIYDGRCRVLRGMGIAGRRFQTLEIPGVMYFSKIRNGIVVNATFFNTQERLAALRDVFFPGSPLRVMNEWNISPEEYNVDYVNTAITYPPVPFNDTKFNETILKVFGPKHSTILLKESK